MIAKPTHFVTAATLLIVVAASNAASVFSQYQIAKPCPKELRKGFTTINETQSEQFLTILAGEEFAGRGTGQNGYLKAAKWVAGKLTEFGLQPKGENGTYFQQVPLEKRVPILDECKILLPNQRQLAAAGNLGFDSYSPSSSLNGSLVFVDCPAGRFQFPQGVSVRDKIVVYRGNDQSFTYVAGKIQRQRPAALFRVVDQTPTSTSQMLVGRRGSGPVSGTISAAAADSLLAEFKLEAWADKKPPAGELAVVTDPQVTVTINTPFRRVSTSVPNVVGFVPGSDPKLRDQYIVVGAHLDHLGRSSSTVFYGADDNGSGSTAVLNIAQAIMKNPIKPKRSVLFVWFAAEELGLIGSKHYVEQPALPIEDMVCMLNIDMVGRNESSPKEKAEDNEGHIHLVGSLKGDKELHEAILAANAHVGFQFEYDEENVFNRSDQYNFFAKGFSVAFMFGGFHPDYHQPTDQVDKINFTKLVAASRLYYLTIFMADKHGPYPVPEGS